MVAIARSWRHHQVHHYQPSVATISTTYTSTTDYHYHWPPPVLPPPYQPQPPHPPLSAATNTTVVVTIFIVSPSIHKNVPNRIRHNFFCTDWVFWTIINYIKFFIQIWYCHICIYYLFTLFVSFLALVWLYNIIKVVLFYLVLIVPNTRYICFAWFFSVMSTPVLFNSIMSKLVISTRQTLC